MKTVKYALLIARNGGAELLRHAPPLVLHLGRVAEAEKAAREAIRLKPDLPGANTILAAALVCQRRIAEAEEVLRKAVQQAPDKAQIYVLFASLLDHQEKKAEAASAYRRALELDPDNPAILNSVGYWMVQSGERLEEARKMIQRAVDGAPGNGFYLDSLGWACFKLGKFIEAEKYLTEAARINSSSGRIQEHLGDLYHQNGKREQAQAAWLRAQSLSIESGQRQRLGKKLAGDTAK